MTPNMDCPSRFEMAKDRTPLSTGPSSVTTTTESQSEASIHTAPRDSHASSASARGVANLTPDQLARKRANDRKAQRAIRERTKTQIDSLNERIRALESQRPHQEVQRAISEKEALQAQNDDIRQRLAAVLGMFRDIIGARGLNG